MKRRTGRRRGRRTAGSDGGDGGDENKLIAERRAQARGGACGGGAGGSAFPNDFRRDALAGQLHAAFGERSGEWLDANPTRVRVGGRLMFKRLMGKASFAKIGDRTGQIQLYLQQEALGEAYEAFKGWDIGDILGASGVLFRTTTGELSVRVDALRLLVKSLRPLPDKWHGLADTETRYRQRYVDLIVSETSRKVFRTRTRIVRYLRDFLDALDFLEVETPMMQPIPGGAAARPVPHAPQCARPGHVPAHRARAVPEAPDRRRLRARLRDQPQLPQRGPVDPAQSRIHDARAVPGVRRLPRPHGLGREGDPRPRRYAHGSAAAHLPGTRLRSRQALPPPHRRAGASSSTTPASIRCRCAT